MMVFAGLMTIGNWNSLVKILVGIWSVELRSVENGNVAVYWIRNSTLWSRRRSVCSVLFPWNLRRESARRH